MAKTTKKDFELFKKECQKWIDYFGLKDWRVVYKHGTPISDDANASFESCIEDGIIMITLNTDIDNKNQLKLSAFHEVVEGMLLIRLMHFIDKRYVDENMLEAEIHSIVRTLENTVFRDVKP